jgi:Helix-turn-helix domain
VSGLPLDDYPDEPPAWALGRLTEAQANGSSPNLRWVILLYGSHMSSTVKAVGVCVESHCRGAHKHAWVSVLTLADESGFSDRTVSRAVRALEAAGFLVVTEPSEWRPTLTLHLSWPVAAPRRAVTPEAEKRRRAAKREKDARYRARRRDRTSVGRESRNGPRDRTSVTRDRTSVTARPNLTTRATERRSPERSMNAQENAQLEPRARRFATRAHDTPKEVRG